jgi:hypothetical protein
MALQNEVVFDKRKFQFPFILGKHTGNRNNVSTTLSLRHVYDAESNWGAAS